MGGTPAASSVSVSSDLACRIRQAMQTRPLIGTLGLTLRSAVQGRVALSATVAHDAGFDDPHQGGCERMLTIVLGDTAGWLAALTTQPPMTRLATLEMKVDLVSMDAPVRVLHATAECVREGRTLLNVRSDITALIADDTSSEADGETGRSQNVGFIAATYIVRT